MILCLDSGNTRIKWGLHDGVRWLEQGGLAHDQLEQLAMLCRRFPPPEQAVLANVADAGIPQAIEAALGDWLPDLIQVASRAQGCGVTNLYDFPNRLGVDRWCALLGAWHLVGQACIVVMAGTATTIDTLDNQGRFLGGVILPGMALMRSSLVKGTAGLSDGQGVYCPYPRNTQDAISSGMIEAQVGAIERIWRKLDASEAVCLLSGGNAEGILPHLAVPARLAHNLPLEGLLRIALEVAKKEKWRSSPQES